MKTILIFIGLKLSELILACMGYILLYAMGFLILFWIEGEDPRLHKLNDFLAIPSFGFLGILAILVCWELGVGIYHLIKWNWQKAKELSK